MARIGRTFPRYNDKAMPVIMIAVLLLLLLLDKTFKYMSEAKHGGPMGLSAISPHDDRKRVSLFSAMVPSFYSQEARNVYRAIIKQRAKAIPKHDVVTLNVGGKIFMTTKATLFKGRYNYFHALLALPPMVDGAYFLDWKPEVFEQVLNYLRTDKLPSDLPNDCKAKTWELLDYLGMKVPDVNWKWSRKIGTNYEFSNNDQTIKFIPSAFPSYGAGLEATDEIFLVGQECHIRLDKFSGELYIGLGTRRLFKYYSWDSLAETIGAGWYLEVGSGQVYEAGRISAEKQYNEKLKIGDVITLKQTQYHTKIQVNGLDTGIEFPLRIRNLNVWSPNAAVLTILPSVDQKITWED